MSFIWLDDQRNAISVPIGNKADGQFKLKAMGGCVPDGFCLSPSIVAQLTSSPSASLVAELKSAYAKLRVASPTGKVIVRSSSLEEDKGGHLFPGIFKSIADVDSFEGLLSAIRRCTTSTSGPIVDAYKEAINLDMETATLALLIQVQLEGDLIGQAKIGGALSKYEITCEAVAGINASLLNVGKPEYAFVAKYNAINNLLLDCRGSNELKEVTTMLIEQLKKIEKLYDFPALIEWLLINNQLYVLQVRPYPTHNTNRKVIVNKQLCTLLPSAYKFGLKAAAMEYFAKKRLFNNNFTLITPDLDIDAVLEMLDLMTFDSRWITVRFSLKECLGLPRRFCKEIDEAKSFIASNWNNGWCCIIHPYLDVAASFELWLDQDDYLLEHVPGLWESDNNSEPDFISYVGGVLTTHMCKKNRSIVEELSGGRRVVKSSEPLEQRVAKNWNDKLSDIVKLLRTDFKDLLPLNFHFIEEKDGCWHFLNLRYTDKIELAFGNESNFYVINSYDDFDNWDHLTPLLIKLTANRGEEINIALIKSYVPLSVTLFVEFGLLSHPAIVLRELGYNVKRLITNPNTNIRG